jgi:soluble lytic murein transglycosylase
LALIAPNASSAQLNPASQAPALAPANDVGYALNDWRRLRQGGNWAFADHARFLIAYPGWPGESTMRRSAERAMQPGENAATVIAFFRTQQPTSANGFARLAEAHAAQGRPADALAAARRAWSASGLSAADEIGL